MAKKSPLDTDYAFAWGQVFTGVALWGLFEIWACLAFLGLSSMLANILNAFFDALCPERRNHE
jgi:hypothetical protein